MKAITIWQPWASLLACGAKLFETRSWATSYRGPIAIHAAKKAYDLGDIEFGLVRGFMPAAESALGIYEANNLPRGVVIAIAELWDCQEIEACYSDNRPFIRKAPLEGHRTDGLLIIQRAPTNPNSAPITITGNELLFGDWTPGRYAWEFRNMVMLPEPIPAKGGQRLWNWEGAA